MKHTQILYQHRVSQNTTAVFENLDRIYARITDPANRPAAEQIQTDFADGIQAGWQGINKARYQRAKKESLPVACFSLTGCTRDTETAVTDPQHHTGLVNLDIDEDPKDILDRFWLAVPTIRELDAAWLSVSGIYTGDLSVNVRIEIPSCWEEIPSHIQPVLDRAAWLDGLHKLYHAHLTAAWSQRYHITIGHVNDLKRARYLNFSTKFYRNPDPQPVTLADIRQDVIDSLKPADPADGLPTQPGYVRAHYSSSSQPEFDRITDSANEIDTRDVALALGLRLHQERNDTLRGFCPVHGGTSGRSFSVSAVGCHCFKPGCLSGGNITLVKAIRNCTYTDAVKWLSDRFDSGLWPAYTETLDRMQADQPEPEPVNTADLAAYALQYARAEADPVTIEQTGNVTHYTVDRGSRMSDLTLSYDRGLTEVNAPCNFGKSYDIKEYSGRHPEEQVIAVFPTVPLLDQFCHDYQVPGVKAGITFDDLYGTPLIACTQSSFVKKFDRERLSGCTVFIDEYHTLVTDAALGFKGSLMSELSDMVQAAGKAIGLTGTPITLTAADTARRRIVIEYRDPQQVNAEFVRYQTPEQVVFQTVRMRGDTIPVIFLNDTKAIRRMQRLLKKRGIHAGGLHNDKHTGKMTPLARQLTVNGGLIPTEYDVILATSLVECGLNINNKNIGKVLIFPRRKRHDTRHQMQEAYTPYAVIQSLFRFRCGYDSLAIAWPAYQLPRQGRPLDLDALHRDLLTQAADIAHLLTRQQDARKFCPHLKAVRDDMSQYQRYLTQEVNDTWQVNHTGIHYLLYTAFIEYISRSEFAYIDALAKAGIVCAAVTEVTEELTADEEQDRKDALDAVKQEDEDARQQELDALAAQADYEIDEIAAPSKVTQQIQHLMPALGKDAAIDLLRTGQHKFRQIVRWLNIERYKATRDRYPVPALDTILTLFPADGETFTSEQARERIAPALQDDPFLCRMLTGKTHLTRLTSNRAIRILKCCFDLADRPTGKDRIRMYQITSREPLRNRLTDAGYTLDELDAWQRFCQVAAENPRKTGKAAKVITLDTDQGGGDHFCDHILTADNSKVITLPDAAPAAVPAADPDAWYMPDARTYAERRGVARI